MNQSELLKFLQEYAKKVTTQTANTADFSDIKNKIRQSYDTGNIPKETMADLGKKASHNFKNMGKATDLQDMAFKITEKGGTVGKFADAAEPAIGKVVRSAKDAGKGLKSFAPLLGKLGMLGAGAAAMGAGQKAMAGDIGGAGMDAADLATDYLPGVGQAKMALQSDELGKGSDIVANKEQFDFSPYKAEKKNKFKMLRNKLAGVK